MPDDRTAVPDEIVHILIVDDDPRVRTMLARYFRAEGFKVSEAGDGAAMRTALAGGDIGLVLLDLVLPVEDGLSLSRARSAPNRTRWGSSWSPGATT